MATNEARNPDEERRQYKRINRSFILSYFDLQNPEIKFEISQLKNISLGGMFVFSDQPPPFGAELTIVAQLPHSKGPLRLPAVVRWSNSEGFGVQFGLLGAVATHAITTLCSS